ncbi:YheC/YheD family protein [Metabacillus herbersteinensis]|uniref:YheC/YheD family protein n=1 Tax=Metabacillus herbersteinensis TaxID=283816 RepID=A0ABV6GIF9_9BACI
MDFMNERICIVSDKELTLQILNLNNVPSIELVDPKICTYPIIGRKYGQHGGNDISLINTKDQAIDDGCDFYTKLYPIEDEYRVEVQALSIKKIYKAVVQCAKYNEVTIRTETFGWEWKEVDINSLPTDWSNVAIRGLYVTGLTHGFVKIGILPNESFIVTDINQSKIGYSEPELKTKPSFTIGADVEFMLSCDDELLAASTFFPVEGAVGCDERQIEKDSGEYALAELRPEKGDSPQELISHIKQLIQEASEKVPYKNVEFRAGSMPFAGYQCGGHLHFGIPSSLSLLRAFDHYLALPIAMIEETRTAKLRRRTNHGGLGRYRVKPYGFEYLSLSSWIIDPSLALSILCLAKLVALHHHELKSDFLFHPLVQRAYYHGNRLFLKSLWKEIKATLMKTSSYSKYESELSHLFNMIENENPINESIDLRRNWGVTISKESYDPGLIIQIPKRMRLKYDLKEGDTTFVCAGKNMSPAIIQAYPFTFRNPNSIHLSKSLREKLNVPKEWSPKLSAANGVITLGPIIGILAARPFERQTTYFQHLCKLAHEKKMFAYVFEPGDILWDQQLIKGTSITGEGLFPFPAVIYDRYFLGGKEKGVDIDEVRAKLQSINKIPFVNPPALFQLTGNKWEAHQLLTKEHEEYLPESRLLEDPADLTEMLDQFGEIYVKPLGGALSIGVIRVIRRPAGIFWMDLNRKLFQQVNTTEELYLMLTPLMKDNPYLVQEGIRRKQYNGKNLEIRVYMQKNEKQIWLRTGMVTRLTSEDVMTEESEMNLRLSKVFNSLYPDLTERRYVINKLAKASHGIVATVEEKVGGFGELAVDLCIDQYNSIKLLEINAKPDSLFSQIRAYKLRTLAGIRLLNYAASLAGYKEDEK